MGEHITSHPNCVKLSTSDSTGNLSQQAIVRDKHKSKQNHRPHSSSLSSADRTSQTPVGRSCIDYSPGSMTLPVRTYFCHTFRFWCILNITHLCTQHTVLLTVKAKLLSRIWKLEETVLVRCFQISRFWLDRSDAFSYYPIEGRISPFVVLQ